MQRAEQFRHAVDHAGERARVIREIELHCVVERDIVRVMSREIAQHLLLAPAEIAHQIVVPESVRICMIEQTPHGGRVDLALHGELRPPIEQHSAVVEYDVGDRHVFSRPPAAGIHIPDSSTAPPAAPLAARTESSSNIPIPA